MMPVAHPPKRDDADAWRKLWTTLSNGWLIKTYFQDKEVAAPSRGRVSLRKLLRDQKRRDVKRMR